MDQAILLSVIGTLFTVSVMLVGVIFGLLMYLIRDMRHDLKQLITDVAGLKAVTQTRRSEDLK